MRILVAEDEKNLNDIIVKELPFALDELLARIHAPAYTLT